MSDVLMTYGLVLGTIWAVYVGYRVRRDDCSRAAREEAETKAAGEAAIAAEEAKRRDHRKILVVDGAVAFTGGLNIGDEYVSGLGALATDVEWRDAHVRVEGPCVRDLEAVFLESWFRADGPALEWHALLEGERPRAGGVRVAVLSDGPADVQRRKT